MKLAIKRVIHFTHILTIKRRIRELLVPALILKDAAAQAEIHGLSDLLRKEYGL